MIYRNWIATDNLQISELEKECFKSPWSIDMLNQTTHLKNFYGKVCEVDGKIVGYIGAIYDFWDGEILNIAVKNEYRKQGIGEKLMQEIIDFLRLEKKENVFLEVRKSNFPAQKLYEKLGFVKIGERKKYYENTEDAIVMSKVL